MFSIHLSFRRHLYHIFFEVPFFLDIKNTIKNKTRVLAGLKAGGGGGGKRPRRRRIGA